MNTMKNKVSGKLAQHFRMCVKMWWNLHSKKQSLIILKNKKILEMENLNVPHLMKLCTKNWVGTPFLT
jgi:hypothetical protein